MVYLLKAARSGLCGNDLPEEQRRPPLFMATVCSCFSDSIHSGSQGHSFLRTGGLVLPQEKVYFLCQSYNRGVGEFLNV